MARRFDRLGWAMDQTDLTPTQRFVLLILADMADEYGLCWPSKATVADRTGYSHATVKRTFRELVVAEVIVTDQHYMANGKQTSNSVRLCLGGRGVTVTPPDDDTDDTPSTGSRGVTMTRRGGHPDPDVEPLNRTSRKNNSLTTSKSRSSRRASARRGDDDGWADPSRAVFDKAEEQEDDGEGINPRGGPDSAWGLNKYYRDSVRVAGNGFLGNTNDKAMRGFFAKAKREGVKPAVLRQMVDAFVTDERLFTRATGGARWRVFIANAETLRQRVVPPATYRAGSFEDVPELSGSIPQHILDKILAEAG